MSPNNRPAGRIGLLDAWRGTAVLLMLGWHLAWDLTTFGFFPREVMLDVPATAVRYYIVCSFLLLAGIVSRFSRSNARRGAVTLLCAGAVSLATYLVNDPVLFGILHCLGCCMLLYAALGPWLERYPKTALAVSLAVFFITFPIPQRLRVETDWLWMFGFRTRAFYSSDYYPLLPWGCLFFAGSALGNWVAGARERLAAVKCPAALRWVGRHALWIYMLHQPVLYGLTALAAFVRDRA